MGISRNEAASALADIESTAGRGRVLTGYRISGPIMMSWGLVWALGYSAMGLLPSEQWGLTWMVLDVIGIAATILFSRRGAIRAGASPKVGYGWKITMGVFVILAFVSATYSLFHPSLEAAMVYPGLITGLIYAGIGIVFAPRYLLVGLAIAVASLVGYYAFQPWLAFWMAAVGGGGLFLSGLWLRKG